MEQVKLFRFEEYREVLNEVKYSSHFWRGGSLLWPETIEIEDGVLTWHKRNKNFISVKEISIPIKQISGIQVTRGILGADLVISGSGGETIEAFGFRKDESREIQKVLKN